MSPDTTSLEPTDLPAIVRQVIAEVLLVPLERVRPESALVRDLGAESIDFLDLIFRLEEATGIPMPADQWDRFLGEALAHSDLASTLTSDVVLRFARRQMS